MYFVHATILPTVQPVVLRAIIRAMLMLHAPAMGLAMDTLDVRLAITRAIPTVLV
jgi:hypothetical protein